MGQAAQLFEGSQYEAVAIGSSGFDWPGLAWARAFLVGVHALGKEVYERD